MVLCPMKFNSGGEVAEGMLIYQCEGEGCAWWLRNQCAIVSIIDVLYEIEVNTVRG